MTQATKDALEAIIDELRKEIKELEKTPLYLVDEEGTHDISKMRQEILKLREEKSDNPAVCTPTYKQLYGHLKGRIEILKKAAIQKDEKQDDKEVIARLEAHLADKDKMLWKDGFPSKTYADEWFIAELKDSRRVVLRSLYDEHSYDFTTADETYGNKELIKRWMQFPDSEFLSEQGYKNSLKQQQTTPVYWTYIGWDGKWYDHDFNTQEEAQQQADTDFAEKCEDDKQNGHPAEKRGEAITLIKYVFDEHLEKVVLETIKDVVEWDNN